MKIPGDKVNLRPINLSDFNKIIDWNKNDKLTYFIGKKLPSNFDECETRYLKYSRLQRMILAIEDKQGNFIGEIEIKHIIWKNKQAELSMYIGNQELWGKGYGYDALNTFINYIFKVKGFKYVYLKVYRHNNRAIRCYEKCGFKKRNILRFNSLSQEDLILMDIKNK